MKTQYRKAALVAAALASVLASAVSANAQSGNMVATNAASFTPLTTYDSYGQVTEPHVLFIPGGWAGYKYWMTAAPYPWMDADEENASIWATNDAPGTAQRWVVPAGVKNPVIPLPAVGAHNADQSILYYKGTMYLYYNVTTSTTKSVVVVSSTDGWKTRTAPQRIMYGPVGTFCPLVSSVIYNPSARDFELWYVDACVTPHRLVKRTSLSPLGTFTSPQICNVGPRPAGTDIWEQNILWTPKGLMALITLDQLGTCGANTKLYYMYSVDGGINWSLQATPVLKPAVATPSVLQPWDGLMIYRGCLLPLDSSYTRFGIWYSGESASDQWHIGYTSGYLQQTKY